MELQQIKPRRTLRFRSKQEIIHLLEKFESVKKQASLTKFCKDHDVPTGTFCTWQRYCRQGKYGIHGKFIALSVERVPAITTAVPPPVFAKFETNYIVTQLIN